MPRKVTSEELERLAMVREMLRMFRFERAVYACVILMSLCMLMYCGKLAVEQGEFSFATAVGVFGPAGPIAVLSGRILKMWDDAKELLQGGGDSA